jgi:4-amino-4-deoxy-L-arabinose transferase-like glycosyltransferase
VSRDLAVPRWLLSAALALPLLGLASPLLEVDDARYAEVPRAMAVSGDWVLPTLDGTPYIEKPPLWYWVDATSYKVFGVSEAAARLPMLVFALLGALGAGWLGSWLYDARVGRAAAAATATSALWIFLAHNLTLDMPVSVCLLWTTAFALRAMARPDDARWAAPAAWACAALAFLSKGLISVLFPGLWVVGLSILFPKLRRGAWKLATSWGMLLAVAVAAPWFWAMQQRRPDFLHVFFIEQHFQRFLTQKYNRNEPVWFYLAVLPAGLLPWTFPALAGFWRAVRKPFGPDFRGPALAAWSLGVTAFFSISHSKLATYVLPVFPHMAILAAAELEKGLPRWVEKTQKYFGGFLIAAAIGIFFFTPMTIAFEYGGGMRSPIAFLPISAYHSLSCLVALLLASIGTAMLVAGRFKHPATSLCVGGALAGACLFAGLRLAAPLVSVRDVGLAVRDQMKPGDQLWTDDTYLQGLTFYSGRPINKIVQFIGEFHYAKRDPAYADRFGDDSALATLPRAGGRTFVAMRAGAFDHFEATIGGGMKSLEAVEPIGPWTLAIVRPAPAR